ncbi:MAG: SPOR domain-containing protein [Desulfarculus sp.]|nr:SPOR domain-containing protein [Desulfarculus sp.]
MPLFCPNCGSEKVLPSTRRSWWRSVQQSLGRRHFLCDDCYHRFTVRGGQDETPPPRVPEPMAAMAGETPGESPPLDGPVFLEPAAPAPDRQWRSRLDPDTQPESEPEPVFAPESASPARLTLQSEREPEPEREPAHGPGSAARDHGLADLQPSLDFAGPGQETELGPGWMEPTRTSTPLLGLWRKVGLGLGLALICLALLLWYRLNLDSAPDSQTSAPSVAPTIREQPTGLPPAAPPLGGGNAPTTAGSGPAVGAIMPPGPEPAGQGGPAQSVHEAASTTAPPPPPAVLGPAPIHQAPFAASPIDKPRPQAERPPRPSRRDAARTKPPTITQAAAGGYRLQFGAFSDPDRAMALAAKLKGLGFKVDLVQGATSQGRTLTKVRSGHFASVREARKARIRAAAITAMDVVIVPPPQR